MRYRVLGTTQALRPDGTAVAVGGARLRALLTVLALRPGKAVPTGLLVAEVWAGEPPADAQGALQALVGRLRRTLGADAIRSADGGYRLTAGPDDVDLHRFERLTSDGTRALADGDPAKAAGLLDDALALWQGPPLADLPDRSAESARWETRRLDALRARHTAALALGHAEQSLPELTALCDTHPLDEPLQALRLRALRDVGRAAEALAAYDTVRHVLSDRLGTDPGPELRGLHGELLNPGAEPAPWPGMYGPQGARRAAAATAPGRAYGSRGAGQAAPAPGHEHGPQGTRQAAPTPAQGPDVQGIARSIPAPGTDVQGATGPTRPQGTDAQGAARSTPAPSTPVADTPTEPPAPGAPARHGAHPPMSPPPPPPPAPGNLRARLTSFVGRESDIAAIRGDLAAARLVTLLGPGGSGKTRLSQEAAETAPPRDGVWLAELAPVTDPLAVPQAVVTAVGARETVLYGAGAEELRAVGERHDEPLERLVEHCARRRMLIILDNCEHVVDAAARLAEELLARCPELTILATSREPLGVPGEVLRPVEPLPEPVALRLLAERGAAARPGFTPAADPEACAEICRRLDGLPLAIELAAARLRMLTPRQIADRLDDRFRLLTSGSRTLLPRQQTLRAVVDWSWDLLDAAERDVLGRLSVFAGGCDLPAAEAVCGPAALEALGSLVDKSLVVAAPSAVGAMRYRLLETVAEYAGERLAEAGRRTAAERAHGVYYRELARTTDPLLRGPGQLAAIERFQTEYENIRIALRRAVAARDEQEALCVTHALMWYWQMRDMRIEARDWCKEVMELSPDPFTGPDPAAVAAPVWERLTDTPPPYAGEALAEARRGIHLAHIGTMDTELGAWQTPAGERRLRVVARTYEPGLPQLCRLPGINYFYAAMLTGTIDDVYDTVGAGIRTCREHPGHEWELAFCLQLRGNLLANRADRAADGARDAEESLEIYRRLGDAWGAAEALGARAEARERRGEFQAAYDDYQEAIEHAEFLGARTQKAVLRVRLAAVLLESADPAATERGEAILHEIIAQTSGIVGEAHPAARLFLGSWLGLTGRVPEAREQLRLLREEFSLSHFVVFDAFILGTEAWMDAVEGHTERGLSRVRKSLDAAADPLASIIAPHMQSLHLTIAAAVLTHPAQRTDRATTAARCLGAAERLRPGGYFAGRAEREIRDTAVRQTKAALGEEEYEAAYAEGGALSFEEAAALV